MGTEIRVAVEAEDRPAGMGATDVALAAIQVAERRLSTWNDRTELSRVNAARTGTELKLSALLHRDLTNAFQCAADTAFSFNPAVGPLVVAWGLRTGGKTPNSAELQVALEDSKPRSFAMTPEGIIRGRPGAKLEEGAFGKGAALDDAVAALAAVQTSRALLDFGGQLSVLGVGETEVQIAHPLQRKVSILTWRVSAGSVSSSGNSEHGRHIIDPISGRPSDFAGTVSVWARSGWEADCLSTALFVMGPHVGMAWVRREKARGRPISAVFTFPAPGATGWNTLASCELKSKIKTIAPSPITIHFDCLNR